LQLGIEARGTAQVVDGGGYGIYGTILPHYGLSSAFGSAHERLGMLSPWQHLLELLELSLSWTDLVDATHHELGLLEAFGGISAHLSHAVELLRGSVRRREGLPVCDKGLGHAVLCPGVEQVHMTTLLEQALMLVLAAKINRCAHALRKLANRSHVPVNGHPSPAVGSHTPTNHHAIGIATAREEPPFDHEGVGAFANGACVGTLAHKELD
jgi:hypothetical protein